MPLFLEDGVSDPEAFSLPTGTVTFLLTDVEGSTRQWEDAPEAMAIAIARHYELLDAAILGRGGVRPVEQGEGDSVVGGIQPGHRCRGRGGHRGAGVDRRALASRRGAASPDGGSHRRGPAA